MNNVTIMGRLCADPEVRYYSASDGDRAVCRFTVATDRRGNGETKADFHSCVSFGKTGEFIGKYFMKGSRILLTGSVQNNNYEKDGVKHYAYQIAVERAEFCEGKNAPTDSGNADRSERGASSAVGDGFMDIPDGVDAEGLPWN